MILKKHEDSKRRKKEEKYWSKKAETYDEWIKKDFSDQYRVYRKKMRSYMRSEDDVLELGTGTGDFALSIVDRCNSVVGIDISRKMIEKAFKKGKYREDLTFQVADAYKLPFASGSFTKVICVNALQVMKEPSIPIREAKRVLKQDGEFLSITYCYGDSSLIEKLKLIKAAIKHGVPGYWTNFECGEIAELFIGNGFQELECEKVWEKPVVHFERVKKTRL